MQFDRVIKGDVVLPEGVMERGYVAIADDQDPRAELVSQHNVAGVVSVSASSPGVPPEAWDTGVTTVLAASSQGTRLLLADALESPLLAAAARRTPAS